MLEMHGTVPLEALHAASLSKHIVDTLSRAADAQLRNPSDAIALACHASMLAVGFSLIGLGEEQKIGAHSEQDTAQPLPAELDKLSSPGFRYKHPQFSLEILATASQRGDKTAVDALVVGDDKRTVFDITTKDFISEATLPYCPTREHNPPEHTIDAVQTIFISSSRLTELGSLLRINMIQKLAPSLMKEPREESSDVVIDADPPQPVPASLPSPQVPMESNDMVIDQDRPQSVPALDPSPQVSIESSDTVGDHDLPQPEPALNSSPQVPMESSDTMGEQDRPQSEPALDSSPQVSMESSDTVGDHDLPQPEPALDSSPQVPMELSDTVGDKNPSPPEHALHLGPQVSMQSSSEGKPIPDGEPAKFENEHQIPSGRNAEHGIIYFPQDYGKDDLSPFQLKPKKGGGAGGSTYSFKDPSGNSKNSARNDVVYPTESHFGGGFGDVELGGIALGRRDRAHFDGFPFPVGSLFGTNGSVRGAHIARLPDKPAHFGGLPPFHDDTDL